MAVCPDCNGEPWQTTKYVDRHGRVECVHARCVKCNGTGQVSE